MYGIDTRTNFRTFNFRGLKHRIDQDKDVIVQVCTEQYVDKDGENHLYGDVLEEDGEF